MAEQLWYFWLYSFLGYLLEKAFAWWARAAQQVRKCCWLLPLCPVYGLGMVALLNLPAAVRNSLWLPLAGGVLATAVEYAMHWYYDVALGVRFWDYSAVRGNLHGRVCPAFSLVWGLLTAFAVWFLHPWIAVMAAKIPWQVTYGMLLLFAADALCAAGILRMTGDVEALRLMER